MDRFYPRLLELCTKPWITPFSPSYDEILVTLGFEPRREANDASIVSRVTVNEIMPYLTTLVTMFGVGRGIRTHTLLLFATDFKSVLSACSSIPTYLVDRRRIELLLRACKAHVLPLSLSAQEADAFFPPACYGKASVRKTNEKCLLTRVVISYGELNRSKADGY